MQRRHTNIMIKLKRIEKNDNVITCYAYFEDCTKPVKLSLCVDSGKFQNYKLPTGYEWCESHIQQAKKSLLKMVEDNNIEREKIIMWY